MRTRMTKVMALMGLLLVAGCGTLKETVAVIKEDPAHAPENQAYYSQRLLEVVVGKLSDAVLDETTPKEIADGIKLALPATALISDALVTARRQYILLKADIAAMEAQQLDPTEARLRHLKTLLDAMNAAAKAADSRRSSLSASFGEHVSLRVDDLTPIALSLNAAAI